MSALVRIGACWALRARWPCLPACCSGCCRDSTSITPRIWAAWPRKSSGFFTDLSQELVRSVGLAAGMTDDKILSLDEIWAALRFVEKDRERLPLPRSAQISLPEM